MSIATEVKTQHLTLRRSREDPIAIDLVTLLVSDIGNLAKEKGRDVTDEETVMIIRRLLKGITETLKFLEIGSAQKRLENYDAWSRAKYEKTILESFLPKQLSEHDLKNGIQKIIIDLNPGPKDVGKVMGEIKKQFGTSVNMQVASQIVKEALQ